MKGNMQQRLLCGLHSLKYLLSNPAQKKVFHICTIIPVLKFEALQTNCCLAHCQIKVTQLSCKLHISLNSVPFV